MYKRQVYDLLVAEIIHVADGFCIAAGEILGGEEMCIRDSLHSHQREQGKAGCILRQRQELPRLRHPVQLDVAHDLSLIHI